MTSPFNPLYYILMASPELDVDWHPTGDEGAVTTQ
jgi:hypothetical protein